LNHLTVPIAIVCVFSVYAPRNSARCLKDNRPFGRLEGTRLDGGAASQAKMRLRCLVGTESQEPVNHGRATLTNPRLLRTEYRDQSKKCG
jgi:hypothetical protein